MGIVQKALCLDQLKLTEKFALILCRYLNDWRGKHVIKLNVKRVVSLVVAQLSNVLYLIRD